jgi:fibronectin type 3 domain-containing protein
MKMEIHRGTIRTVTLLLAALCLTVGIPDADAQDASTIVYVDALFCRVHAADCPDLVLKEQKQTMTLGEADQLGYRIGESGQSGRIDCCLQSYTRQYPLAVIENDAMGVAEVRLDAGGVLKYHVHGCHRFTPDRDDYRMTKADTLATPGSYLCEHCLERGPGFAQMTQTEWDKLPSHAPWEAPLGWAPSPFPTNSYPDQGEIDILLSETLHGDIGLQDRAFINPVATVDNWMIMRYFFPVHRWLELYQAYRSTGDTNVLEQIRGSARHYNTLSTNYLSAAQYKARDPEGLAYMYTMAASARITLQLALKYPSQVTASEVAEAEDFLMTIISVLAPTCEDSSNLDPTMGIPKPLADDFRDRAFNRALNGIGTIGMTVAALEDLQTLNSTTAYQSTIDRYRKIIREYIINWKNTGFSETYNGDDYFSYPYAATDSGTWVGDVKLFSADDQGHFSHSMQGCYILYDSVPELGIDAAFMTSLANTIEFNSHTTSGSPQTPSQEAIRPYSRYPYGLPSDRFYLLQAFNDGVIGGQCSTLSALATESVNSEYAYRLATFNAQYLKELSQDRTLIHMGEDSVAPPAPPTGLTGTGSNGQVSLDWDDNTESDMASGTYAVYRSTTSGSGYALIATNLTSSAYVDTAVVNDTLYFYVVTATDTNNDVSVYSIEEPAAPFIADGTAPAVPTGMGANVSDSIVSLDWDDNSESDLNSYNIYRSTTSESYGAALATSIPSEYVDTNVVNGTTYYYVIEAVDHSGNQSAKCDEISAKPASYGPKIIFGTNHDGDGGFGYPGAAGTELWTLTADSVNYAFGTLNVDEAHTTSLLKSYTLDRSDGTTYTIEGVVDLTDGYGDDNNRIGVMLFNPTSTQTDDGGGLYLQLNTDGKEFSIREGLNGTALATASASGSYSGDSWIGTTINFSADVLFTNIAGTDKIDVDFTFTDQNNNTDTISAQVDAANYTDTYCGFVTKWRQRGDDPTQNTPPEMDYRSFMVSNHTVVVTDTTPPAAPTGLGATAGDEYVSLDWTDNTEGDMASGTYSVYRSTTSESYAGALKTGLFLSSYVDYDVVNGSTYYYKVTATDTNGNESVKSSEVSATPADTTPADTTPPVPPTGLTATAGDRSVSLEWNSSGEEDLAGYSVYRSTNSGSYGAALAVGLSTNAYIDDAVSNGMTYYYAVTAKDSTGNESLKSTETSATPEPDTIPPAAPTGLTAAAGDNFVRLTWMQNSEADLDSYKVYRSTTSSNYPATALATVSTNAYVDGTAENGTTYYYVVTAVDNGSNESFYSAEATVTPADWSVFNDADAENSLISNPVNWSTGLPTNGLNGSISITAKYDSGVTHAGYKVLHSGGTLSRGSGYTALALGSGTVWLMDGASAAISATRGLNVDGGQFTLNQGDANLTDDNRDTILQNSASLTLNGGTMTVARDLIINNSATFTINGGTLTGIDQIYCQSYRSAAAAINFNGGTTTADNFQFDTACTVTFGGSTAGSLSLLAGLGNGATLNWLPGTKMTMTVANADEWAETEWNAGRLTYNGQGTNELLKTWAEVTETDGLGTAGVNFEYDSVTETLSLVSGAALTGYDLWATTWNTENGVGAATNDFDGDGINNLGEYAMGGNPTNELNRGTNCVLSKLGTGFVFVHPQRSDDATITYQVEVATHLISSAWTNAGVTAVGTNITGGVIDFVTNDVGVIDRDTFFRLKIEQ